MVLYFFLFCCVSLRKNVFRRRTCFFVFRHVFHWKGVFSLLFQWRRFFEYCFHKNMFSDIFWFERPRIWICLIFPDPAPFFWFASVFVIFATVRRTFDVFADLLDLHMMVCQKYFLFKFNKRLAANISIASLRGPFLCNRIKIGPKMPPGLSLEVPNVVGNRLCWEKSEKYETRANILPYMHIYGHISTYMAIYDKYITISYLKWGGEGSGT